MVLASGQLASLGPQGEVGLRSEGRGAGKVTVASGHIFLPLSSGSPWKGRSPWNQRKPGELLYTCFHP